MKKIILALFVLFTGGMASFAQCGQNVTLTSSKTEYLDAAMTVQRTVNEASTIELRDSVLTITTGQEAHKMTGTIQSNVCSWTAPFKKGISIVKTIMKDENGDAKHLNITIEGKDGTVTLFAEVEEMPEQKIRVAIDKFESKK